MTTRQTAIYTFHKVREQCEQGTAEAWRAFLDSYGPLALRLLELYPPGDPTAQAGVWKRTLTALAENDFARFRATSRQSEREFLADLRALLLDLAAEAAEGGGEAQTAAPPLDAGAAGKLLDGLPLLHQEMLFLRLAGYTDATIEKMLRMAPRVAQSAFARLEPDYAASTSLQQDGCPWPRPWLVFLREARVGKKETCTHPHQFLRIQDGQVSWYDKEPVEKHVSGCLHCLEAWTALREVSYWRKAAQPLPPERIEEFLSVLPLSAAPKKPFLRRVFG